MLFVRVSWASSLPALRGDFPQPPRELLRSGCSGLPLGLPQGVTTRFQGPLSIPRRCVDGSRARARAPEAENDHHTFRRARFQDARMFGDTCSP
eukprot:9235982-Pyramimonas_sp.AAC.1